MSRNDVQASPAFKKMAVRAILSIVLFVVIYLILVAAAVGLTILSGYGGIFLITEKPSFISIILGIGLIGAGLLILIFLVKFIFTKNKADRSHLIEITEEQQPRLFAFVREIVRDAQSKFPKKIYLSADVNAAVFYDSGFWSMFFPVKKNLLIGMGLVNAVSENEFRAILAHEFGHFSQRSMKVRSYVYNVNKIIYNMLFDNSSYQKMVQGWASISGYFSVFIWVVVKIVQGIQWVLRKVYGVVNLSYMGLSREMEFHADEVAASVGGSSPLITSLRRLSLADHAYNAVLNFYNDKIAENVKTENIYPQHQYTMQFLAKESKLPVEGGLPQVTEDHLNRYNKSKLVIKDQWASHPSTEDRIEALIRLNRETPGKNVRLAIDLFDNVEALQKMLTDKLFAPVEYSGLPSFLGREDFEKVYGEKYQQNTFPPLFNTYYDNRNIPATDTEADQQPVAGDAGELFSNTITDTVYESLVLENDINVLKRVQQGEGNIKTFDYNGQKYTPGNCAELITELEASLNEMKLLITANDSRIYQYFNALAERLGKGAEMRSLYEAHKMADKEFDRLFGSYLQLFNDTRFVEQQLGFEAIEQLIPAVYESEGAFKNHIRQMLEEERYRPEITDEARENFRIYLSDNWVYFDRPSYDNYALSLLSKAMNNYHEILSKSFLRIKKDLLLFMAMLEERKRAA